MCIYNTHFVSCDFELETNFVVFLLNMSRNIKQCKDSLGHMEVLITGTN